MLPVFSSGSILSAIIRANNWLDVNLFTKWTDMTKSRSKAGCHNTFMLLATVEDNSTLLEMFTGFGSRFNPKPGFSDGRGFYKENKLTKSLMSHRFHSVFVHFSTYWQFT